MLKLRDVFLAGNFAETLPSNSSRYVTQLYEQARDAQQAVASYRVAMKAGDPAKAEAIQNASGDQLMRAKRLEKATQILSKLNQQAHQIEADRKLSGQEKRRLLDEIEQQRDQMARQAQAVD